MATALVSVVLAIAMWAITAAAAGGRIPDNQMVGIRTPATRRSAAAWRAGHQAALVVVAPASALVALAGIALAVVRPSAPLGGDTGGAVLLGLYLVAVLAATVLADRAARQADDTPTRTRRAA